MYKGSLCLADKRLSVTMTTTAVTRRSAGEVTCHLSATGTRKKLPHLLLAAIWTNERYCRSVDRFANVHIVALAYLLDYRFLTYAICHKHDAQYDSI